MSSLQMKCTIFCFVFPTICSWYVDLTFLYKIGLQNMILVVFLLQTYFRPLRPIASPKAGTSERNRSPPGGSGSGGSGGKPAQQPKKKYKFW